MKWLIRRCRVCGEYTLKALCGRCGGETIIPHPPKFSPQDKYSSFKRRGEESQRSIRQSASRLR
ncbi:MAG: RNA-protein complex protein Nop10 [Candidatus Bathyarchaeia archaeon]